MTVQTFSHLFGGKLFLIQLECFTTLLTSVFLLALYHTARDRRHKSESAHLPDCQVGAWSSDSEGESNRELFYLSTEPGAAAREGWYDLDVQTSKRPFSSTPESGRWKQAEEWTSVRVGGAGASSDSIEGEEGGRKKAASKKKKGNREFGKRSKSHKNQADQSKSRTEAQPGGGGDGGGSGEEKHRSSGVNNDSKGARPKDNSRANDADANGAQPPSSSKTSSSGTVGREGGADGREGNNSHKRVMPDTSRDGHLPGAVMPVDTGKRHSSSDSPSSRPEKRRREE